MALFLVIVDPVADCSHKRGPLLPAPSRIQRRAERLISTITGASPTSTRVSAGREAHRHSPSLVRAWIRTARVSQLKSSSYRQACLSLRTSTNTSIAALRMTGSSSGNYTREKNWQPDCDSFVADAGRADRLRV